MNSNRPSLNEHVQSVSEHSHKPQLVVTQINGLLVRRVSRKSKNAGRRVGTVQRDSFAAASQFSGVPTKEPIAVKTKLSDISEENVNFSGPKSKLQQTGRVEQGQVCTQTLLKKSQNTSVTVRANTQQPMKQDIGDTSRIGQSERIGLKKQDLPKSTSSRDKANTLLYDGPVNVFQHCEIRYCDFKAINALNRNKQSNVANQQKLVAVKRAVNEKRARKLQHDVAKNFTFGSLANGNQASGHVRASSQPKRTSIKCDVSGKSSGLNESKQCQQVKVLKKYAVSSYSPKPVNTSEQPVGFGHVFSFGKKDFTVHTSNPSQAQTPRKRPAILTRHATNQVHSQSNVPTHHKRRITSENASRSKSLPMRPMAGMKKILTGHDQSVHKSTSSNRKVQTGWSTHARKTLQPKHSVRTRYHSIDQSDLIASTTANSQNRGTRCKPSQRLKPTSQTGPAGHVLQTNTRAPGPSPARHPENCTWYRATLATSATSSSPGPGKNTTCATVTPKKCTEHSMSTTKT